MLIWEDGEWGAGRSDYGEFEVMGSDNVQEMSTGLNNWGRWKTSSLEENRQGILTAGSWEVWTEWRSGVRENDNAPGAKLFKEGREWMTCMFAVGQAMDGAVWWPEIPAGVLGQRGRMVWEQLRGSLLGGEVWQGPPLHGCCWEAGGSLVIGAGMASGEPTFPLGAQYDCLLGFCY